MTNNLSGRITSDDGAEQKEAVVQISSTELLSRYALVWNAGREAAAGAAFRELIRDGHDIAANVVAEAIRALPNPYDGGGASKDKDSQTTTTACKSRVTD